MEMIVSAWVEKGVRGSLEAVQRCTATLRNNGSSRMQRKHTFTLPLPHSGFNRTTPVNFPHCLGSLRVIIGRDCSHSAVRGRSRPGKCCSQIPETEVCAHREWEEAKLCDSRTAWLHNFTGSFGKHPTGIKESTHNCKIARQAIQNTNTEKIVSNQLGLNEGWAADPWFGERLETFVLGKVGSLKKVVSSINFTLPGL